MYGIGTSIAQFEGNIDMTCKKTGAANENAPETGCFRGEIRGSYAAPAAAGGADGRHIIGAEEGPQRAEALKVHQKLRAGHGVA